MKGWLAIKYIYLIIIITFIKKHITISKNIYTVLITYLALFEQFPINHHNNLMTILDP